MQIRVPKKNSFPKKIGNKQRICISTQLIRTGIKIFFENPNPANVALYRFVICRYIYFLEPENTGFFPFMKYIMLQFKFVPTQQKPYLSVHLFLYSGCKQLEQTPHGGAVHCLQFLIRHLKPFLQEKKVKNNPYHLFQSPDQHLFSVNSFPNPPPLKPREGEYVVERKMSVKNHTKTCV